MRQVGLLIDRLFWVFFFFLVNTLTGEIFEKRSEKILSFYSHDHSQLEFSLQLNEQTLSEIVGGN